MPKRVSCLCAPVEPVRAEDQDAVVVTTGKPMSGKEDEARNFSFSQDLISLLSPVLSLSLSLPVFVTAADSARHGTRVTQTVCFFSQAEDEDEEAPGVREGRVLRAFHRLSSPPLTPCVTLENKQRTAET